MRRKTKKTVAGAVRNPDRTRDRILEAAFVEFAAKGFVGARVDEIARRADVNKRMLYHYFGDKEGLFGVLLRKKMAERQARVAGSQSEFIAGLPVWFGKKCGNAGCRVNCSPWCAAAWFVQNSRDRDWIRVLAWEALQAVDNHVLEETQRRRAAKRSVAGIRQCQTEGKITAAFAPEHLQLAMVSLAMFPVTLPQIARLIVGRSPADPKFQHDYAGFLREFALVFRPAQPRSK
jgi:AcrR family transcriptional regulator